MFNQSISFSSMNNAPKTKALYKFKNNSFKDFSNNGYTGLTFGTPVMNSSGYNATTSNINYIKFATGLDTYLAAATIYAMDFRDVSLTTLTPSGASTLQMLWSNSLGNFMGVFPDGHINMTNGGGALNTSAGVFTANTNSTVTYTQSGTSRKLYLNGSLKVSDSAGTTTTNSLGGFLGRYSNSASPYYQWQGPIGQVRVQTAVPLVLPIQD